MPITANKSESESDLIGLCQISYGESNFITTYNHCKKCKVYFNVSVTSRVLTPLYINFYAFRFETQNVSKFERLVSVRSRLLMPTSRCRASRSHNVDKTLMF